MEEVGQILPRQSAATYASSSSGLAAQRSIRRKEVGYECRASLLRLASDTVNFWLPLPQTSQPQSSKGLCVFVCFVWYLCGMKWEGNSRVRASTSMGFALVGSLFDTWIPNYNSKRHHDSVFRTRLWSFSVIPISVSP